MQISKIQRSESRTQLSKANNKPSFGTLINVSSAVHEDFISKFTHLGRSIRYIKKEIKTIEKGNVDASMIDKYDALKNKESEIIWVKKDMGKILKRIYNDVKEHNGNPLNHTVKGGTKNIDNVDVYITRDPDNYIVNLGDVADPGVFVNFTREDGKFVVKDCSAEKNTLKNLVTYFQDQYIR